MTDDLATTPVTVETIVRAIEDADTTSDTTALYNRIEAAVGYDEARRLWSAACDVFYASDKGQEPQGLARRRGR